MDMRRILIFVGHPDPDGSHFCHGLAAAYRIGAEASGHEVRRIDIARLQFPLLSSQEEFSATPPPVIARAQDDIAWAEHIVLIFPLWLGTMPARLKAFFEQVLRPDFAFAYTAPGRAKKLLAGRSARLVVTMGMPSFVYRWYFLAHGLRGIERNILSFVGIRPVRTTLIGNIERIDAQAREDWLTDMTALGMRGA